MQLVRCSTLILASASPRRVELLQQIGVEPKAIIPAEIDETPRKEELPKPYVARMAREKGEAVAALSELDDSAVILAADTIVACGRRVLGKPADEAEARAFLRLLSGRRHQVHSAVWLGHGGRELHVAKSRVVTTRVQFKQLTQREIDAYIASGEWEGKAGAYAIQGKAARFVVGISGSYSNVVGLPLLETANMLESMAFSS